MSSADQIGHAPAGKRMIGTILPAAAAGACGGRRIKQSAAERTRIIELSWISNANASSLPSRERAIRARR